MCIHVYIYRRDVSAGHDGPRRCGLPRPNILVYLHDIVIVRLRVHTHGPRRCGLPRPPPAVFLLSVFSDVFMLSVLFGRLHIVCPAGLSSCC